MSEECLFDLDGDRFGADEEVFAWLGLVAYDGVMREHVCDGERDDGFAGPHICGDDAAAVSILGE